MVRTSRFPVALQAFGGIHDLHREEVFVLARASHRPPFLRGDGDRRIAGADVFGAAANLPDQRGASARHANPGEVRSEHAAAAVDAMAAGAAGSEDPLTVGGIATRWFRRRRHAQGLPGSSTSFQVSGSWRNTLAGGISVPGTPVLTSLNSPSSVRPEKTQVNGARARRARRCRGSMRSWHGTTPCLPGSLQGSVERDFSRPAPGPSQSAPAVRASRCPPARRRMDGAGSLSPSALL